MEPVRTRPEVRPRKPFMYRTDPFRMGFAYFNSTTGLFVHSGRPFPPAVIQTRYPLVRIRRFAIVLSNPSVRMFDQLVKVYLNIQGDEINGISSQVYVNGSIGNSPIFVDCDLLISPNTLPELRIEPDIYVYAMSDFITVAGFPPIALECDLSIEISGEYVDI